MMLWKKMKNTSRKINLWCPFRKDLRDVMCICYLPSAILHHLSTQALQNCFLMKCKVTSTCPSQLVRKGLPLCSSSSSYPGCRPGESWPAWEMAKLSLEAQTSRQVLGHHLLMPSALMLWTNAFQHWFLPCCSTSIRSQDTELINETK